MAEDEEFNINLGDIGLDDFDFDSDMGELFDFADEDDGLTNAVQVPKAVTFKSKCVKYSNAQKMAKEIALLEHGRIDAFIAGNFIFGDFIEAWLVENYVRAQTMTLTTLSMSQENIDSLANLMQANYIGSLDLIISVYFYGNERHSLIPYIYETLGNIEGHPFRMAIAGIHTKTVHFLTEGGKKVVIHGSANLRSSGNIEQFTMELNDDLYDFYDDYARRIMEKYNTINKAVRNSEAWNTIN